MDDAARPMSRRTVLAAGAVGLLTGACAGGRPTPAPAPGPGSSSPARVRSADWSTLDRHLTGPLRRPGDPGYRLARLTENPRYDDARPLAVVSAADETDVATAIGFAQDHGLPLAIRSGGHSYPGYSAGGATGTGVPPSLVIDCRGLRAVRLAGTTATVGAGASLATAYAALAARGRAIPGGSCPTVGIGGLTQGGGVGVLTRALGLTCDSVTALRIVTADGRARTAGPRDDPDLFWAARGGGGGHLGVVTGFDFATAPAPTVTTFYLAWPFVTAPDVVAAWQAWAPSADARLWSTLKLLAGQKHPKGPTVFVAGTWIGAPGSLAGQLDGLLAHLPPPTARTTTTRGYGDAMASYAGCAGVPVARCTTGPGGALTREALAATSHVGYVPLGPSAIDTLVGRVDDARSAPLHEAGVSLDALGGRVRDLAPGDTAFVHRHALMTVQYTATFAGPSRAASSYVHGFRAAMTPSWGRHAYVNYADPTIADYRSAYFGANAARLAATKREYDPHGVFTQPQGF